MVSYVGLVTNGHLSHTSGHQLPLLENIGTSSLFSLFERDSTHPLKLYQYFYEFASKCADLNNEQNLDYFHPSRYVVFIFVSSDD